MIYGLGMIDVGMTLDFAQLVVDNEIAKMVRKIIGGISVSDETMAVDLIRTVGAGGHFLAEQHTVRHMKKVQSQTNLFDRNPHSQWEASGGRDLSSRALDKARNLLKNYKPEPLAASTVSKLRDLVQGAAEEWGVK